MRQMPTDGQLIELRIVMHKLLRMSADGQPLWRTRASVEIVLLRRGTLLDLKSNVRQMPTGGQLIELHPTSSCANPQFTLCCAQGKVTLPLLAPPPEPLRRLLIGKETDAKDFRQHIRSYNSALAFTSVGANLDTSVAQPGNYTYRLRGELYHRMGSLLPQLGEARKFAQLYISDPHAKLDGRMGNFGGLNRDTM